MTQIYSPEIIQLVIIAAQFEDLILFFKSNRVLGRQLKDETSFLRDNARARERLWYVENNTTCAPKCKICNNDVKWNDLKRTHQTYCSTKCSSNDVDIINKKKQTCINKYGSDHPWKNDNIRQKQQQTMIDRYGKDYKNDETIKSKRKNTNIERYGVPNSAMNGDIKQKQRKTIIDKYGGEHHMKDPKIVEKVKNTNIERYGYTCSALNEDVKSKRLDTLYNNYGTDNPFKNKDIQQKRYETMQERYGVNFALQNEEIKHNTIATNMLLYGTPYSCMSEQSIIKRKNTLIEKYGSIDIFDNPQIRQYHFDKTQIKMRTILGDDLYYALRDYKLLTHMHHSEKLSLTQIAIELKTSASTISKWFNRHNIPVNLTYSSVCENDLYNMLRTSIPSNIAINRHDRSLIHPFELDIIIPQYKIAIEYNGIFWHSEGRGKDSDYHLNKTIMCNALGYDLIHVREDQWTKSPDLVISRILAKINLSTNKIYARKTTIMQISSKISNEFLDTNHIQRHCASSIQYGLYYNNELVSVMTFGKSRFSKQYEYELLRLCNSQHTTIHGGPSKLFSHFIKQYNPKSVISYSDVSWNSGDVYSKIGFKYSHNSNPNYYYFKLTDTSKLYHRANFQKHKLATKLNTFDSELTEWKNMQNNNYDRIWDCGNGVWVWKQ